MKHIAIMLVVVLFSGCTTLTFDKGAAGVVKQYKPEYSGIVDQVSDLLVGKRVNPVEGYAREERWYLKDEEVNPADLKLEVTYRNSFQVNPVMLGPSKPNTPPGEVSDAELRAEIEAILKAAGVE